MAVHSKPLGAGQTDGYDTVQRYRRECVLHPGAYDGKYLGQKDNPYWLLGNVDQSISVASLIIIRRVRLGAVLLQNAKHDKK